MCVAFDIEPWEKRAMVPRTFTCIEPGQSEDDEETRLEDRFLHRWKGSRKQPTATPKVVLVLHVRPVRFCSTLRRKYSLTSIKYIKLFLLSEFLNFICNIRVVDVSMINFL